MIKNNGTAAEYAKSQGFEKLGDISVMTGVSLQTLDNWFKHKNRLFKIVIFGCKWINKNNIEL